MIRKLHLITRFQSWLQAPAETSHRQRGTVKANVAAKLSSSETATCSYQMGNIPSLKGIEEVDDPNSNSYSAHLSDKENTNR